MAFLKLSDLEKINGGNTLQLAWAVSYRNYLRLCEPITTKSEMEWAIAYADKVVESLKKCERG